jgi:uncharacterized SAM-binding protein YcdF (DUF218 family)
LKVSELNYDCLTPAIIDKILFEGIEDSQLSGDCIMVLGSKIANKYRIPKAYEIYSANRSNKILLSGGKIIETEYGNISEAENMQKKLLKLGVSLDDIIIENTSLNTIENFICSLLPLQRIFKLSSVKSILLVTTRYHMRRSLLMANSFLPKWIEILPCPADDSNTLRHNWFLHEKNYKIARDEAFKIACYIRDGIISDFQI